MERTTVAHGMLCEEDPRDIFAVIEDNRFEAAKKKEAEKRKKKNAELKRLRASEDLLTDLAFKVHIKLLSTRSLVEQLTKDLKEKEKEIQSLRAVLDAVPHELKRTEGSIEMNKTEPEIVIETGHTPRGKRIRRTQYELLIQEGKK